MKNFFLLMITICMISISGPAQAEEFIFHMEDLYDDSQDNSSYFELLFGGNFLVGASGTDDEFGFDYRYNNGYIASGSLGYRWCHGIRWEFEYAYRWNKIKEIKIPWCNFPGCVFPGCNNPWHKKKPKGENYRNSSLMVNLLWDIPLEDFGICTCITPIFGLGAGYDLQHAFEDSKNGFAWQVIVGVGYRLTPCTNVSIEYKWHGGPLTYIFNHSVGLGITYTICSE
ncbi:MAG: outer membrane beta-barrel protein [Parachlamydiales bacterium]|jgi:opacity protein-like surface antigen